MLKKTGEFGLNCVLVLLGLLAYSLSASARIRGGSGYGLRNSLFYPPSDVLHSFQLIVLAMLALVCIYLIGHKKRIAVKVRGFAEIDPVWELSALKQRIKEVFVAYQSAEQENEPLIARRFLTASLLESIEDRAMDRLSRSVRICFKHTEIEGMAFVSASRAQDGGDRFWVLLKCSMIRYWADVDTGDEIEGNAFIPESYQLLCKFVRSEQEGWVADSIDPYRGVMDILALFPDRG